MYSFYFWWFSCFFLYFLFSFVLCSAQIGLNLAAYMIQHHKTLINEYSRPSPSSFLICLPVYSLVCEKRSASDCIIKNTKKNKTKRKSANELTPNIRRIRAWKTNFTIANCTQRNILCVHACVRAYDVFFPVCWFCFCGKNLFLVAINFFLRFFT